MTTTITTAPTIKGISDSAPTGCCEHCGRADLKRYVVVEHADGTLGHYGTTCGPRALNVEAKIFNRAMRDFEAAENAAKLALQAAESNARQAPWFAFLAEHGTGSDNFTRIKSLGGFTAARAAYAAMETH